MNVSQFGCGSFLALVLVVVLCLGLLIGCNSNNDSEQTTVSATEETVKTMTVTVMSSFPGLESVDATGFYCMDESQQLWRVAWSDTSALQPGKKYTVRVENIEPCEPATSGWSPKFKGTATSVTPVA